MISIGMGVNTSGLSRGLKQASGEVQAFGSRVVSVNSLVGTLGAGLAGLGIAKGISDAVKQASSLHSGLAKVRTIFGDDGGAIVAEADRMAESLGVVKSEYLDAAAGFGAKFKNIGKSASEAADLGNQLTKLGVDLARFNDTTDERAFTAISAALRGEFDTIEQFNIDLSADAVKAEAVALGLAKAGKEIDITAKRMGTFSLITKQSADAMGAAAREVDEVGSQMSALGGRAKNLAAEFGTAIEPLTGQVLGFGGNAVAALGGFFDENKATITAWATGAATSIGTFTDTLQVGFGAIGARLMEFPGHFAAAFGDGPSGLVTSIGATIRDTFGSALEMAGIGFRNLPDFLDIAVLRIAEGITNVGEYLGTIPANAAIVGNYLADEWPNLVADGLDLALTSFINLAKNIRMVGAEILAFLQSGFTDPIQIEFTPLLEGVKLSAAALPEMVKPALTSLQAEIDAKIAAIGDREAARTLKLETPKVAGGEAAAKGAAGTAAAATPAKSKKKPEDNAALQLGSVDFRSAVLRFEQGGGKDKGIDAVAKNTTEQVKVSRETRDLLKRLSETGIQGPDYSFR